MSKLRILALQADLSWENPAENRAKFAQMLENAPLADLIVLPEMFSTGFSMDSARLAESMQGESITWMQNLAKEKNALVIGSLIIAEKGKYFNRLLAVSAKGVEAQYDKRHLFRMANEQEFYSAGEEIVTFEWQGWRIRPLICYDLRFPVWSRRTAAKDYDILLYVANWPERRSLHWESLLRARAIENQAFVIGVNRVGSDGKQIPYDGKSALIDPLGNYLAQVPLHSEGLLFAEFDEEVLRDYREKFPAWKDADNFSLS